MDTEIKQTEAKTKIMDTKTKILSSLMIIFAVSTIVFGALFFTGCKSLHPIIVKDQPQDCNDFYTVMDFYVQVGKGQDSAFIGTVYTNCSQARKEIRDNKKLNDCKDMWFGKEPVDKSKYDKYTGFLECTNKK